MADNRIDKGLPNITPEPIPPKPGELEVDVTEEQVKGPIEVTPEPDGGATVEKLRSPSPIVKKTTDG